MGIFRKLLDQINRALERHGGSQAQQPTPSSSSAPYFPQPQPTPSSHGPTCYPGDVGTGSTQLPNICHNPEHICTWTNELDQYNSLCLGKQCSWIIPFAGNAFLTDFENKPVPESNRINSSTGLINWNDGGITPTLFFHCDQPGRYSVGLRVHVPAGSASTIRVTLQICTSVEQCQAPQAYDIRLQGTVPGSYQVVPCGQFSIGQKGYVKLILRGLQKSGPLFADVSHAILIPDEESDGNYSRQKRSLSAGPPEKTLVKFVSDPEDFYFGRRGPSVHLQYIVPPSSNPEGYPREVEYFYNEILVPPGQDVVGSYFCAIGFSGGYFGIQVNSESERRILFSIWSAYTTDNPNEIPQDYQVTPIRKGSEGVHVGEFGHEGSGAQSYLRYPWKANTLYKFLVHAQPLDENNTMFSAWFADNEWQLIASFKKPKVCTYLQGLYSFSENFIPEMGHVERQCLFGNQWAWDNTENGGSWVEITNVKFTADATAQKGTRRDVAGGVVPSYGWKESSSRFYLRNCGFFTDRVEPGTDFCRSAGGSPPTIDFSRLP